MNKNLISKSVTYQAPEVVLMESVTESLLCISDGVQVDPLTEVNESW